VAFHVASILPILMLPTLNFCKQLGDFRLEIDQTLTAQVTAFLGPSGSGKSTLLI